MLLFKQLYQLLEKFYPVLMCSRNKSCLLKLNPPEVYDGGKHGSAGAVLEFKPQLVQVSSTSCGTLAKSELPYVSTPSLWSGDGKKTRHEQKLTVRANTCYHDTIHKYLNAWQWAATVHWTKWKLHLVCYCCLILLVCFSFVGLGDLWGQFCTFGTFRMTPEFVIVVLFCRPCFHGESVQFKYRALWHASWSVKTSEGTGIWESRSRQVRIYEASQWNGLWGWFTTECLESMWKCLRCHGTKTLTGAQEHPLREWSSFLPVFSPSLLPLSFQAFLPSF